MDLPCELLLLCLPGVAHEVEFNFSAYKVQEGDTPTNTPTSCIWCPLSQACCSTGYLRSKPRVVSTLGHPEPLPRGQPSCLDFPCICILVCYHLLDPDFTASTYLAQCKTMSQTPHITTSGLLQTTVGHKPDGSTSPSANSG